MKINQSRSALFCAIILTFLPSLFFAQPANWEARGPGGGGAYFGPSINPANLNEIYVTTDMSGLYHSLDYGLTYSLVPFSKTQGGSRARVQFTNNPNIRYFTDYTEYFSRPFKTTDGGATWFELPGNPSAGDDVYSLWVDYDNPNRIVQHDWSRIFISQDGGSTFTQIHTMQNSNNGVHIAGVFFDGQNVFIATNDGLLVSTNGGATFTDQNYPGLPAGLALYSFCGAKKNGVTRFFGLAADFNDFWGGITPDAFWSQYQGVYRLDFAPGATWKPKISGIPAGYSFVKIGMAENNLNVVYISGRTNIDYPTVVKTTNSGTSWSEKFKAANNVNVATGYCGQGGDLAWYWPGIFFDMTVARNQANRVLVTDYGFVHKTSNGGTAWQQAYLNPADQHPAGQNTPQDYPHHSIGLENTSVWQVAWFDSLNLFAGYSDIKGVRSTDGGVAWDFGYNGHDQNTMYRMVKNNTSNAWYAATSDIHDMYETTRLQDATLDAGHGKVLFTTDKGANWQVLHDFGRIVMWVATDPGNANRLFAAVVHSNPAIGGIWKSDNIQLGSASTWTKLPNPLRTEGHPFNIQVLNDGKVLCTFSGRRNAAGAFTASSGVFLFDPAANSWADRSHANMFYYTKDITVDPNDAAQNTWYTGVWSGWGGPPNDKGGLYKTTNRGTTWTRLNDLHRVSGGWLNPLNANELYFTTEVEGLWHSTNINAAVPTFSQVPGYAFRHPKRVFFNPFKPAEMWVTSFGNGIRVGSNATCAAPATAWTSAVPGQPTARKISWAHVFGSVSYQMRYRLTGTTAWTTVSTTVNYHTLAGLSAGQNYQFQVRAKCSSGSFTPFSPIYNFGVPAAAAVRDLEFENANLQITPNPAGEKTTLNFGGSKPRSVVISDVSGRVFYRSENIDLQIQLEVKDWPTGVYMVLVEFENGLRAQGRLVRVD